MQKQQPIQIPAVLPEKQFPEIADEIANWKIGYLVKRRNGDGSVMADNTSLAFDRRKRMPTTGNNVDGNDGAAGGFVDTIRMGRPRIDQVQISQFMHFNLPASMHDRQVTNFEVRRMMQRSRAKKGSSLFFGSHDLMNEDDDDVDDVGDGNAEQQQNHGIPDEDSSHNPKENDQEAYKRKIRREILYGRRKTSPTNAGSSPSPSSPSAISIITKLSVMDPQVVHRKGKELTEMIQDAARAKAAKIPFPNDVDSADSSQKHASREGHHHHHHHRQHEKPSAIQVWYHRLGMELPSKK